MQYKHGAMLFLVMHLCLCQKENIVSARLPSGFNVFIGNVFVLLIEGMLACVRFPSWSILVFGNALELVV